MLLELQRDAVFPVQKGRGHWTDSFFVLKFSLIEIKNIIYLLNSENKIISS